MLAVALYRSKPEINWNIAFMGFHDEPLDYAHWSDYVVYKTNDQEYEHCKWTSLACMSVNEDYDHEAEDPTQPQILAGSRTQHLEDGSLTDFWDLKVFTVQDSEFWQFLETNVVEGKYLFWGTDNYPMLREIEDWARENPNNAKSWLESCDPAIATKAPFEKIQRAIQQGFME